MATAQLHIYDPAQDKSVPTPVRVSSVLYYMEKDPAIREKISSSSPLIGVRKRNGEVMKFPPEVYAVAAKIHADGKDALEIGKSEILHSARQVLGLSAAVPNSSAKSMSTEKGTRMVRQTIHGMLNLTSSLVSKMGPKVQGHNIVSDIEKLTADLGLVGAPELTTVVPYSIMISASQLASVEGEMSKHVPAFEALVKKFQKITSEA